ncbi:hypothetical protein P3X46_000003 [Hevea brasiliensis]|uniref:Late embryogenesis abundant protein LEA-2 subgroup domain-containing protein n=1 Tax=Hevea brasiliensis TaxID=3981 RepID=A0ABQ9NA24_HEVBR|nr:uncharacterized protein LOC110645475 [Hevea brasiliensis]KAJ9188623.1 hypothetical protein P3X46_000003 [Hevea brasiliensis]
MDPNSLPISSPGSYGLQPPSATLQINSAAARPNQSRSFHNCITRLMLLLVMSFLTLSFVSAVIWLVIDPHDPTFGLNSLCISNITLSDSQFTANYDIEFSVNNTNKKVNLVIDDVKVTVSYGRAIISLRVLEAISVSVPKTTQEKLMVVLDRHSVHSIKNRVFKEISDDWSKKIVNFNVGLFVRTKYDLGVWPTKKRFFHVSCLALTVEFLSTKRTGKLMSAAKGCSLHLN